MGGPSLPELRERIDQELAAGNLESAAGLFNDLPVQLRRPVEILGVLHVLARVGASIDRTKQEAVQAIRPDGSTRQFVMPVTTVTDEGDESANRPAHRREETR